MLLPFRDHDSQYFEMESFVRETIRQFGNRIDFVLFSLMAPMGDGPKNLQSYTPTW